MPFKSPKQEKYMFANHPKIAKDWADKYGNAPKPEPKKAPSKPKK